MAFSRFMMSKWKSVVRLVTGLLLSTAIVSFSDRHGELMIQVIDAVRICPEKEGLAKVAAEREQHTP